MIHAKDHSIFVVRRSGGGGGGRGHATSWICSTAPGDQWIYRAFSRPLTGERIELLLRTRVVGIVGEALPVFLLRIVEFAEFDVHVPRAAARAAWLVRSYLVWRKSRVVVSSFKLFFRVQSVLFSRISLA